MFKKYFPLLVFILCVNHAWGATLYYNGADGSWSTLTNWWTDSGFTTQATSLPTSGDDVILSRTVSSNSGAAASVNTLTFNDGGNSYYLGINITVANGATFNNTSYNRSTITGNATFNTTYYNTSAPSGGIFTLSSGKIWRGAVTGTVYGSDNAPITSYAFNGTSYAAAGSTLTGNVDFNNTSICSNGSTLTIIGDVTFNDSVHCSSSSITMNITGNATFYDTSRNSGRVTVSGTTTFNDSSYNSGTITGTAIFNGNSYNFSQVTGNATFNGNSYTRYVVTGDATFNTTYYDATAPSGGIFTISGTKYWEGVVNGTVYGSDNAPITSYVFNDTSYNKGTITGNTTFNTTYYDATAPSGGIFTISGTKYWQGRVIGTVYGSDSAPITSYVFNDTSRNSSGTITGNATFNNTTLNTGTTVITGTATFNDTSYNNSFATITGDTTFNDTSYNNTSGDIVNNAIFRESSYNLGNIRGNAHIYTPSANPIGGTVL